ncbi:PepSY domain-containing protein [Chitinophaga sedimenti]|uniref:PepSY domain-containing protein n=1 Tax=Chitinophaga sedimenti TaxID=2033606 RepID=UPI0020046A68|nr:PepSY domain-containing protein [Chitinophaga sedimenti]MCK7560033.1 PepSY domain-containing protein [Chitinophaga sedimenti]
MKKIFAWLHLWLGLISGIVVFIISITGAIYAWQPEISEFTQPYRFVTVENKPYKSVTDIRAAAEKAMNGKKAFRILYEEAGKAPVVQFYQKSLTIISTYM